MVLAIHNQARVVNGHILGPKSSKYRFSRGGSSSWSWTPMRLTAEFAKIGSVYPTTALGPLQTKCFSGIMSLGPPFSSLRSNFYGYSIGFEHSPRPSLFYYIMCPLSYGPSFLFWVPKPFFINNQQPILLLFLI